MGPAGREAALLGGLFLAYEGSRAFAADDAGAASAHARAIVRLESAVGLDVEAAANGWLAAHHGVQIAVAFWYATLHYLVTPLVLLLLWRRAPALYRRARGALVAATGLALVCYLVYPVAPPRLMPGYSDSMLATSGVGWWGGHASTVRGMEGLTNQYAAMPSMHVGWAVWAGVGLALLSRRLWVRALAWAYPVGTTLVVVATANHWTLDALAGAGVVLAAAAPLMGSWRTPSIRTAGADAVTADAVRTAADMRAA